MEFSESACLFSGYNEMPDELMLHITTDDWREICETLDSINSEGKECAFYFEFFCCLVCVPVMLCHPCISHWCKTSTRSNYCRQINMSYFGGVDIFFTKKNTIYINKEALVNISVTRRQKSCDNPLSVMAEY